VSEPQIFEVTLYDIRKRPEEVVDVFGFSISTPYENENIQSTALEVLKDRDAYKNNDDIRNLVLFLESGGDTAGYEFDVLPEALRRVRLEIRRINE
jgi:hypothetical protein